MPTGVAYVPGMAIEKFSCQRVAGESIARTQKATNEPDLNITAAKL
jgi:hypothetical protein